MLALQLDSKKEWSVMLALVIFLVIFEILKLVQLTEDSELSLSRRINTSQRVPSLMVLGQGFVVLLIRKLFFHS